MPSRVRRGVDLVQDRLAGQAGAVRSRPHPAVHLGGEHDLLAAGEVAQRAAGDLLAAAAGVDVGGVEEVDARLEGVPDERPGRVLVEDPLVAAAGRVAPAHAAQGDGRDVESGGAELRVAHDGLLRRCRYREGCGRRQLTLGFTRGS